MVRTPDGRITFDETGRLAGRGAYLCADGNCWRQALEKGTLQRALEVPLPDAIKDRLRRAADQPGTDGSDTVRDTATNATMNQSAGATGLQASALQAHGAGGRQTTGGEAVGQK